MTTRQAAEIMAKLTEIAETQKSILTQLAGYDAQFKSIFSTLASLSPPNPLSPSTTVVSPSFPTSTSPSANANVTYAAIVKATLDRQKIEEKATRLVAIGLPEGTTEEATKEMDCKLVQELAAELNVPQFVAALAANQVNHFRHGAFSGVYAQSSSSSPSSASHSRSRRRVLKLQLPSAELRTLVLEAIRRRRPDCLKQHRGAYWRRDLTEPELILEREAKATAKALNQEAGRIEYGVRDINLYKYPKPRAFSDRI